MNKGFSEAERKAVYRAIRERRDVRRGFLPDPLPDDLLQRLLACAHQAPSVGLMQPWRFIVVRDRQIHRSVHEIFREANAEAVGDFDDARQALYTGLKLEGLLEAPQHICVVCDENARQGHGLGRKTMPETALYSAVCAIQNLWLAARAEGVGVGWVSILHPEKLRAALNIPSGFVTVAYLCIGYVNDFLPSPELENAGWETRTPLAELVSFDRFDDRWRTRSKA
ncbi:5,6-dimethylbenzimidazole synthase [Silvibacterium acidisoli]|uniref:5,6-dimethylbenzimidazole synthase n=1 Tax=Acidobacteriaceae bacterium ZG23-2 TaxID=2883246 RepID=UPI00406D2011